MALVGDTFFTANDQELYNSQARQFSLTPEMYDASRKRIACGVDYIVPGHGAMFPVGERFVV